MKRIAAAASGLLIASLVCSGTPRAEQSEPNAKGPKVTVKTVEAQVLALQALVATLQTDLNALHPQDFAVVASDGTFVRGSSSVVSSANLSTGDYEVIFNKDVTGCAYVATIGTTSTGIAAPGEITVAGRGGNPNGVFIAVQNSAGTGANNSFHLSVSCP